MVDQQHNNTDNQNMNDKDDDYPSISEVTTIMREGGDNEAQCYAYRYVSEEQDKGNFCKYMQKNWKWKTAVEDRSENNYNEENEHEKNNRLFEMSAQAQCFWWNKYATC